MAQRLAVEVPVRKTPLAFVGDYRVSDDVPTGPGAVVVGPTTRDTTWLGADGAVGILGLGARTARCREQAGARGEKVTTFHLIPPCTHSFSVSLNSSIMAFHDRRSVASW